MKRIVLMCAGGMSTSILMKNIEKAVAEEGLDCEVSAHSVAAASKVGRSADVILVGPQVGYLLGRIRSQCPDVPIEVIPMAVYGMMDGAGALSIAKKAMGIA